jgi:hypothetical protein
MTNEENLKSFETSILANTLNHCLPRCEEICKEGFYRCYETCPYDYGDRVIEEWLKADVTDDYDAIWERVIK